MNGNRDANLDKERAAILELEKKFLKIYFKSVHFCMFLNVCIFACIHSATILDFIVRTLTELTNARISP